MSKKQVFVILSILVFMGILLSLDIKKAGKPAEDNKPSRMPVNNTPVAAVVVNIDSLESKDLAGLDPDKVKAIKDLDAKAKAKANFDTYSQLGDRWASSNNLFWAGHFYFKAAEMKPDLASWLKAGNALNESLINVQDTSEQRLVFQESNKSFTEALKLDSANLDAKTGLGVSYVAGGESPMQGIGLLLQVVAKDPNNIKANYSLGLFSMKSGQYQKAINRFKTVISLQPSAEAYFYLAQAYQNTQMNKEAIDAYIHAKKYLDDPQTISRVDHLIKELTK